jgi:hypothetical protein
MRINNPLAEPCHLMRMATFAFRCPTTKRRVQGWTAEDVSDDDMAYLPIDCVACRQMHYVNPATGKVLGSTNDDE